MSFLPCWKRNIELEKNTSIENNNKISAKTGNLSTWRPLQWWDKQEANRVSREASGLVSRLRSLSTYSGPGPLPWVEAALVLGRLSLPLAHLLCWGVTSVCQGCHSERPQTGGLPADSPPVLEARGLRSRWGLGWVPWGLSPGQVDPISPTPQPLPRAHRDPSVSLCPGLFLQGHQPCGLGSPQWPRSN